MNKLLLALFISGKVYAMEQTTSDIASRIASIIEQYDSTKKADDDDFKVLVTSYFTGESKELAAHVMPLLRDKLKAQDVVISDLVKSQDKDKLELFISGLVTESLEDAFKNQSDRFKELKALADTKLRKTQYALIASLLAGLLGIGGIVIKVWLGF